MDDLSTTQGIVANSFYSAASVGILTALSERDPADFPERRRAAYVILLNPISGDFHGSPEEDPRLEAVASGCWQLGLPGPRCEPSVLSLFEENAGRIWVVNPRDLGLDATSRFGGRVEFVGDRNGDGVPDLAVSSPNGAGPGLRDRSGAVFLLSGRTGEQLARFAGRNPDERFGASMARFGTHELAIGAPGTGTMAGRVDIVDLRTVKVARAHAAGRRGDRFGWALEYDSTGEGSLLIGAPGDEQRPTVNGAVYAVRGSALQLFAGGDAKGDRFGHSLASSQDADWILVGAPGSARGAGTVSAWMKSGQLRWKVSGESPGVQLGAGLAILPLDNSDKEKAEFIVGAPGLNSGAPGGSKTNQAGGTYVIDEYGHVQEIQRGSVAGARLGEFVKSGPVLLGVRQRSVVLSGRATRSQSSLAFRVRPQLQ